MWNNLFRNSPDRQSLQRPASGPAIRSSGSNDSGRTPPAQKENKAKPDDNSTADLLAKLAVSQSASQTVTSTEPPVDLLSSPNSVPSTSMDDEEDYVPESLRDFIAEANQTLEQTQKRFLSSMSTTQSGDISAAATVSIDDVDVSTEEGRLKVELERRQALHLQQLQQQKEQQKRLQQQQKTQQTPQQPPQSTGAGFLSPDLFQSPPPHPTVGLTESQVKREALEGNMFSPDASSALVTPAPPASSLAAAMTASSMTSEPEPLKPDNLFGSSRYTSEKRPANITESSPMVDFLGISSEAAPPSQATITSSTSNARREVVISMSKSMSSAGDTVTTKSPDKPIEVIHVEELDEPVNVDQPISLSQQTGSSSMDVIDVTQLRSEEESIVMLETASSGFSPGDTKVAPPMSPESLASKGGSGASQPTSPVTAASPVSAAANVKSPPPPAVASPDKSQVASPMQNGQSQESVKNTEPLESKTAGSPMSKSVLSTSTSEKPARSPPYPESSKPRPSDVKETPVDPPQAPDTTPPRQKIKKKSPASTPRTSSSKKISRFFGRLKRSKSADGSSKKLGKAGEAVSPPVSGLPGTSDAPKQSTATGASQQGEADVTLPTPPDVKTSLSEELDILLQPQVDHHVSPLSEPSTRGPRDKATPDQPQSGAPESVQAKMSQVEEESTVGADSEGGRVEPRLSPVRISSPQTSLSVGGSVSPKKRQNSPIHVPPARISHPNTNLMVGQQSNEPKELAEPKRFVPSKSAVGVSSRLLKGTASSQTRRALAEQQKKTPPRATSTKRVTGASSRLMTATAASRARDPTRPNTSESVEESRARARERIRKRMEEHKRAAASSVSQTQTSRRARMTAEEGVARARERVRQQKMTKKTGTEKENRRRPNASSSGTGLTIPNTPKFATTARRGARPKEEDRTKVPTLAQSTEVLKRGLRGGSGSTTQKATATTTRAKLTIPQAPKFETTKRYGETKAIKRDMAAERTLAQSSDILMRGLRSDDLSVDDNPKRTGLTIPHAPHFVTSDMYGERTLSAQGRSADISLANSFETLQRGLRTEDKSLMEKREPKLTIPKTPKFHKVSRREAPKSTSDREKEMMDYYKAHPFKARPYPLSNIVPRRPAKSSMATPVPFQVEGEERRATAANTTNGSVPSFCRPTKSQILRATETTAPSPRRGGGALSRSSSFGSRTDDSASRTFRARPAPPSTFRPPTLTPRGRLGSPEATSASPARSGTQASAPSVQRFATTEASRRRAEAARRERELKAKAKQEETARQDRTVPAQSSATTPVTKDIKPFQLESVRRHEANLKKMEEKRQQEEMERQQQMTFHARAYTSPPKPELKGRSNNGTKPEPFHLGSLSRHEAYEIERKRKLDEERLQLEKQKQFKAKPLPKTTHEYRPLTPRDKAASPKADSPATTSSSTDIEVLKKRKEESAAKEKARQLQLEKEQKELASSFKAKPVPKTTYEAGLTPRSITKPSNRGSPSSRGTIKSQTAVESPTGDENALRSTTW